MNIVLQKISSAFARLHTFAQVAVLTVLGSSVTATEFLLPPPFGSIVMVFGVLAILGFIHYSYKNRSQDHDHDAK